MHNVPRVHLAVRAKPGNPPASETSPSLQLGKRLRVHVHPVHRRQAVLWRWRDTKRRFINYAIIGAGTTRALMFQERANREEPQHQLGSKNGSLGLCLIFFFLTVVHRSPRGVLSLTHDDQVPAGNRIKRRLAVEDDAQGSS